MEDDVGQRIARMRALVSERFTDWGALYPEKMGKKWKLFEIHFKRVLLAALLDGDFTVAETFFDDSVKPCATIFAAIASLVEQHPACWVQAFCHDGAYTELRNIWVAEPVLQNEGDILGALEQGRADEGGPSALALVFDDGEGMIMFQHGFVPAPPYCGRLLIAFFGSPERRRVVRQRLKQCAQSKTA